MVEPDANSPAGGESGAPKPKFKTNRVNLMFKAVASDPSSEPTASPSESGSSSSASAAAVPATKHTSFSNGVLKLGKKKDHSQAPSESDRSSVEAESRTPPPETSTDAAARADHHHNTSETSSGSSVPSGSPERGGEVPTQDSTHHESAQISSTTATSTTSSATGATISTTTSTSAVESTVNPDSKLGESSNKPETAKAPEVKKQTSNYTQEELSSKGISVAGRFHSSSNENWEDEEDDWAPPVGNAMQEFRRRLSSSKHLPPTFGVGSSSTAGTGNTSNSSPSFSSSSTTHAPPSGGHEERKAGTPSLSTKSQSPAPASEGPAWGVRTTAPVAKSLSQTIKEAKEKGTSPAVASMNRPTGLGDARSRTGLSAGPGGLGGSGLAAGGARAVHASSGGDALSRFRLQAPVQHMGRGAPPLNPRAFETDFNGPPTFELETPQFDSFPGHHHGGPPPIGGGFNSFRTFEDTPSHGFGRFGPPSGPPPVDNLFMNAKPRRALDEPGPSNPPPRPVINPRPIPDRLRRDVPKPDGLDWQKKPMKPQPAPVEPKASEPTPKAAPELETKPKDEGAKPETKPDGVSESSPKNAAEAEADAGTSVDTKPASTDNGTHSSKPEESTEQPAEASHEATASTEEAGASTESGKSLVEQQHEEMHAMIEQVKARKEAEMKAEKEKQERLAKLREQYRREAEEKRKAEKEAEKAKAMEENEKKNAKKLQLERRRIEMEQRMKARAEEKAERERKQAEEAAKAKEAEEAKAKEAQAAEGGTLNEEEEKNGEVKANEEETGETESSNTGASAKEAAPSSADDIAAKTAKIPSRLLKASIPKGPKADTLQEAKVPSAPKSEARSSQAHAETDAIMGIPVAPQPVNALGYPVQSRKGKPFLVKLPDSDKFSGEVDISDMLAVNTVDCKPSDTNPEDFHGNASYRSRYALRKPRSFKKPFKKLN